jgi:hypothetical protein
MSTVQFKTHNDVGIEYVTKVNNRDDFNLRLQKIYKITINNCENYFHTLTNTKYVGYIENNIFYVVSVNDDPFEEDFKNNFTFIDKQFIDSLQNINSRDMFSNIYKLKKIPNFEYIRPDCVNIVKLHHAREILLKLNKFLNCINYKISINYIFQLKEDTEINAYEFEIENLLLCIFHNDVCVSSLVIRYNNIEKEISIDSKTNDEYEGKKLNKLLRAIVIIISKRLYSDAKYMVSNAINPTSAYLMIKYFNAIPFDHNNNIINKFENYDNIDEYLIENIIHSKVELTEININNAINVFKDTCKQIKCDKVGGSNMRSSRKPKRKTNKTLKKHKKPKSKSKSKK